MSTPSDCNRNTDPLRLVREGTRQDQRLLRPLDPAYFTVDERSMARHIVFARDYAQLLRYFDGNNAPAGTWLPFFASDVSAKIAILAVEDVEAYKSMVQSWFQYLNHSEHSGDSAALKDRFGYLFSAAATLALRLDEFGVELPESERMKATWKTLVRTQLAPLLSRLIGYYLAARSAPALANDVEPGPTATILRQEMLTMGAVVTRGLSDSWTGGMSWTTFLGGIHADASVFGDATAAPTPFTQINHCTTHSLFRGIFDGFLRALSRLVAEANEAIDSAAAGEPTHEPHYALYLTFLRLFRHVQGSVNTLTQRHLDFYYREVLRLKEREARPAQVHLLAELAKQADHHEFRAGDLLRAGKDGGGKDAYFAADAAVVANRAGIVSRKSVYRHGEELVGTDANHKGRIYASPIADSGDGAGAEITTVDQSWHPFFNKQYQDGNLTQIQMPVAQVGFAISSHYLMLSEGKRRIQLELTVRGFSAIDTDYPDGFVCRLTHEKGWLDIRPESVKWLGSSTLQVNLLLEGEQPAITPYVAAVHGQALVTDAPVLQVLLKQDPMRPYLYGTFQSMVVDEVSLTVVVDGLKSLAAANDFGPVDLSKPFQPFGAVPAAGSSLVLGSKELFQKSLAKAYIGLSWQIPPSTYSTSPRVWVDLLRDGQWQQSAGSGVPVLPASPGAGLRVTIDQSHDLSLLAHDALDIGANEPYTTSTRHGFVRLRLDAGVGQAEFQAGLIAFLKGGSGAPATQPVAPVAPTANALSVGYIAATRWSLLSSDAATFRARTGRFFHIGPFGAAERHAILTRGADIPLLPPLAEAEFYLGIKDLKPPENLSVLFQTVDGTANPMAAKPSSHLQWSYLRENNWVKFDPTAIQDSTDGWLNPGIITLAVPRDASCDNTLLDPGLYWIRAAVSERSDAVCRLQKVAAQGLSATFKDQGNASDFGAKILPAGTISKLAQPDAEVKGLLQPFASFGGTGREPPNVFYTRISERLRHKNRAIDLWDYEHLVLEAFPEIFRVKCLNHTQYEPTDDGVGIYRELAPGHVTVVTIPLLKVQNLRDPLRPYTNLGVLKRIEAFLKARCSGFVQLHVKNPQFEALRVRFKVRLREGYDETHAVLQLQQVITRFLSPWAFADGSAPAFGGKVHVSALVRLIEEQGCVDYLTDFQLFQRVDGAEVPVTGTASGSLAISVLVSAPAPQHEITVIHPAATEQDGTVCGCAT